MHKPQDLLKKDLILSRSTLVTWPQWFAHQGLSIPEFPYTLSFDRSYMSLEAATHGLGFVLESNLLTQNYLESGKLVRVLQMSYRFQSLLITWYIQEPTNLFLKLSYF